MFVTLLPTGPGACTLGAAGQVVGWLRGRTMHVGGFGTHDDALEAGDAGYLALVRWVARRRGEFVPEPSPVHVAATDDGSFEWMGLNGECVARLIPASDVGGVGVEFTLPEGLLMAVALGAAAQMCDAMFRAPRGASYDLAFPTPV